MTETDLEAARFRYENATYAVAKAHAAGRSSSNAELDEATAARHALEAAAIQPYREALFVLLTQTDPFVVERDEWLPLLTDEQYEALTGYARAALHPEEAP